MIPYLTSPSFHLGPVTIHLFGLIVAVAVWTGVTMASPQYKKSGLDVAIGERMNVWIGVAAVLGAHLFSVIFYFPEKVAADPWLLLRLWEDISSFGGMLGGLIGAGLFLWWRNPKMDATTRWGYLDVVAFVFPFSHAIGRVGCSLAHDHPGTISNFPLAVSLKTPAAQQFITDVYANAGLSSTLPPLNVLATMGFNDLGWYELLFMCAVVLPVITIMYNRARRPGTMVLTFGLVYLPVRFAFDFLRVSDERYLGLTPGQWVAVTAFLLLPVLYMRIRTRDVRTPAGVLVR
ncbi:MAG: prolipoprotein diacylglyceryl transferase family protein [Gemmatimonadaceae bacterium]